MKDVDEYVRELFAPQDDILRWVRAAADKAGLPQIQVPPETGRFLEILVRLSGARRVLEVGALGGYSAVWIARALAEGSVLVTLEIDPHHAAVARRAVEHAGVAERVQVMVGDALELFRELEPSFDAIFLDADKENYLAYLEEAARLLRPGGCLLRTTLFGAAKWYIPPLEAWRSTWTASTAPWQTTADSRRRSFLWGTELLLEYGADPAHDAAPGRPRCSTLICLSVLDVVEQSPARAL